MNENVTSTFDATAPAAAPAPPRICFVLSAGRTGTVFLTHLLERHFPQAFVVHEPFPARYELILGNLRNDTGFGKALLRWVFRRARERRLRGLRPDQPYIELNPMLCPLCDLLPQLTLPFGVVHLVRRPLSWAESIASFRASKPFRPLIRFVPFAKPYPHPRPKGWAQLNELERALWRWRFCNEQIQTLIPYAQSYTVLRYEDLFARDPERRDAGLKAFLKQLPIDFDGRLPEADFGARANPKPATAERLSVEEARVEAICGKLMANFGYAG